MDDFLDEWCALKADLRNRKNAPTFNEREIWWCSLGLNIGFELYGKGKIFTRPVLILKKFNKSNFLALPLSTKLKTHKSYFQITVNGKESSVVFGQARTLDSKRLANKMAKISENHFAEVKREFKGFI